MDCKTMATLILEAQAIRKQSRDENPHRNIYTKTIGQSVDQAFKQLDAEQLPFAEIVKILLYYTWKDANYWAQQQLKK